MANLGTSGIGTELRRWDADATSAAGAWELIAGVKNISGPGMSRETFDTTTLDTVDGYRTFKSSIRDGGTLTFTALFTRAGYELMKADFEDDVNKNYEIVLPDDENTSLEFEGMVTELPLNIVLEEAMTMDITIKISGKVNIDSGSGS